jgi:hypothetical protein
MRRMRTRTRRAALVAVFSALALGSTASTVSDADAGCKLCVHQCCRDVRGDGYEACIAMGDPPQCYNCANLGVKCRPPHGILSAVPAPGS